jgi:hypothetical protein
MYLTAVGGGEGDIDQLGISEPPWSDETSFLSELPQTSGVFNDSSILRGREETKEQ